MLREFHDVKQEAGGARRRWFDDEALDLIVWYGPDGRPAGFQLCYPGPDQREFALTWHAERGLSHGIVRGGDERPDKDLAPVVQPAAPAMPAIPWERLSGEFLARSEHLDREIRAMVSNVLSRRTQ